jgi:hypothetical protein
LRERRVYARKAAAFVGPARLALPRKRADSLRGTCIRSRRGARRGFCHGEESCSDGVACTQSQGQDPCVKHQKSAVVQGALDAFPPHVTKANTTWPPVIPSGTSPTPSASNGTRSTSSSATLTDRRGYQQCAQQQDARQNKCTEKRDVVTPVKPLWRCQSFGADHALEPAKPRRPSSRPCTRESLWVAGHRYDGRRASTLS